MSLPDRPDGLVTLPSDWPRDLRRPAAEGTWGAAEAHATIPAEGDRLAEIKTRLAALPQPDGTRRFYGPYSAIKDLAWLVAEIERLRARLAALDARG